MRNSARLTTASGAVAAAAATVWLAAGSEVAPASFAKPWSIEAWPATAAAAKELRDDALTRARVWRPVDVAAFDFGSNPADPSDALSGGVVNCRFLSEAVSGTTPKFNCVLADGEIVKVKYGRNPEIPAEAAATRLLAGLGFGADRIYIVPRVRCFGCPPLPFHTSRVLGFVNADRLPGALAPDTRVTEFEWVAIERRMEARPIEVEGESGWAWFELAPDHTKGGATHAEVDAFRLMAAFLVHWDNKAANQRLVCLTPAGATDQPCPEPLAMIQDLGATFGPHKVDLRRWRETPVWSDRSQCRVSMRHLPFLGATFPDSVISEDGRRLLAGLLSRMTGAQIEALFKGARFGEYEAGRWFGPSADEDAWREAFEDRVRQIVEAGPCENLRSSLRDFAAASAGRS
jgi:hypothetical protein